MRGNRRSVERSQTDYNEDSLPGWHVAAPFKGLLKFPVIGNVSATAVAADKEGAYYYSSTASAGCEIETPSGGHVSHSG